MAMTFAERAATFNGTERKQIERSESLSALASYFSSRIAREDKSLVFEKPPAPRPDNAAIDVEGAI